MAFEKQDSFTPKRSTNIDGFFARPAPVHQRQPVFRSSGAKPQFHRPELIDMPRRSTPQQVMGATDHAVLPAVQASSFGAGTIASEQPRRRRSAEEQPEPEPKKRWRQRRRERKAHKKEHTGPKKRLFKRIGLGLGVLVLLAGCWFGFKFYRDIAKLTGNKNPLALLGAFNPVPLKNQNGRVNVLLAANSADDPGHNGANLTDSIMVLSIDTSNNTALILSIPRDLWVNIPGNGYSKINAAYPDGGMDTLQQIVQKDMGLTVDYQALVSYDAFRDLVNAVGDITITIQSTDPRGIYDPNIDYTTRNCCALAKYPNGPVTLNGKQALNLARARGDPNPYGIPYGFPDGDFDRTEHQRQMILAIKDKADQASVIANPFKVSALVDAVGNNIKTNLQLDEIETLYTYMKKIGDNSIASYNVNTLKGGNTTMLANYTSPDGQSALVPAAGIDDYSDIQAQIKKILSSDPVAREGANVEVLNGTSVDGLAGKQVDTLTNKGITTSVADAPANQANTTIIDNSAGKMPNTLAYLKQHYNATVTTDTSLTADYPSADFILVLGQSAAPATASESDTSGVGQ